MNPLSVRGRERESLLQQDYDLSEEGMKVLVHLTVGNVNKYRSADNIRGQDLPDGAGKAFREKKDYTFGYLSPLPRGWTGDFSFLLPCFVLRNAEWSLNYG